MSNQANSQELLRLYLLQRDKMSEFERDIIIRTLHIDLISKENLTEEE